MLVLDLHDGDLDALVGEIKALGLDPVGTFRKDGWVELDPADPLVVLRALDHLRNRGATSRGLDSARNSLLVQLSIPPLSYRLRSWHFDWTEQDQRFWSYTGPYNVGDRLIVGGGIELRVFSVELEASSCEPGVLVVEQMSTEREPCTVVEVDMSTRRPQVRANV
jgi:hypothetical protein